MKTTIVGYPRIGKFRELKFAIEKYWRNEITKEELKKVENEIKNTQWNIQKENGISISIVNDFSYYDGMLDTSVMLNAIPSCYRNLELDDLDTYFAMGRGYQGEKGDVKALSMKKWFNTNYHYMVPELYDDTEIKLNANKFINEYKEGKSNGIRSKSIVIGPFTFIKLAVTKGLKKKEDYVDDIVKAYKELISICNKEKIEWIQIDEPILVTDLTDYDKKLFKKIYNEVLKEKDNVKILLQTYFGDIRDNYCDVIKLPFDGIGLDFIEGKKTKELISKYGFPKDKILFAGIINGKNIWKNNYKKSLELISFLREYTSNIILSTSCSLLHVPYTINSETNIDKDKLKYFAFAEEKLKELAELAKLCDKDNYKESLEYINNQNIITTKKGMEDSEVRENIKSLKSEDFFRKVSREDRQKLQRKVIGIPKLATTTIGSFPQTAEVKKNRKLYKNGEISKEEYDENIFGFIKECIELQENIGLDILVHGEYERNDMVEFFGENFEGYVFTKFAWVQSYGSRCVKPPIIFGDVRRVKPISVKYTSYANSLTNKPVKGMLTGPVTILNWSFPREDISQEEMAYEIALAIRDEVLDLEKAGIQIIQIDEAALREKLPLRKEDWHSEYLDWALKSFRICSSEVKPETQIHTHMCYSEFEDIIKEIDEMDADVITFEASRSKLTILDSFKKIGFETEVGPGVYDIHSPRVPSVDELVNVIELMINKVNIDKLWINPDCGLKTRGEKETVESLTNLVKATNIVRERMV